MIKQTIIYIPKKLKSCYIFSVLWSQTIITDTYKKFENQNQSSILLYKRRTRIFKEKFNEINKIPQRKKINCKRDIKKHQNGKTIAKGKNHNFLDPF